MVGRTIAASPVVLAVASRNPVKLDAARRGYERIFPRHLCHTIGRSVSSGVADQPMSEAETWRGAENRAAGLRDLETDASFWLGIEGGVADDGSIMTAFACIVILGLDGRRGTSRSASFSLPPRIAELVRGGLELGDADDRVFGTDGSKQRGGAVGLLTRGAIDRATLYAHAVSLAFIPFRAPDHF